MVSNSANVLGYTVTDETAQYLGDSVENLLAVISAGGVDAEALSSVRQYINRKVTPALAKEWKAYYQKKTPGPHFPRCPVASSS